MPSSDSEEGEKTNSRSKRINEIRKLEKSILRKDMGYVGEKPASKKIEGKIEIHLEQHHFFPGDFIHGKVLVDLKEPVKAQSLTLNFVGVKKIIAPSGASNAKVIDKSHVHREKKELGGNKEYHQDKYEFFLQIPKEIETDSKDSSGVFSKLGEVFQRKEDEKTKINWLIGASLNINKNTHIRDIQEIKVGHH